jgi:hypothetical protein
MPPVSNAVSSLDHKILKELVVEQNELQGWGTEIGGIRRRVAGSEQANSHPNCPGFMNAH